MKSNYTNARVSRILMFTLTAVALFLTQLQTKAQTGFIISEYIEGSGNNKFVELYNGTGADLDLSDYQLRLSTNGGTSTTNQALSGTLANGAVLVFRNSGASIGTSFPTGTACNFNGDDALAIVQISTGNFIDIFGRIGCDPGSVWTATGGLSTVNLTLRRQTDVCAGITVNPTGTCNASSFTSFASEWELGSAIDDISGLGSHTMNCSSVTASVSSLTDFGTVAVGSSSASASFTVSGTALTNDVTVTPPADFEISTDDITFGTSAITLTQSGGDLVGEPVTIYVQFAPGSPGPLSGNVTLTSSGASSASVAVSGTGLGSASNASDIILDGGFTYTSNIAYANHQAADADNTNGVAIGQFIVRDGGASADADALATILNSISFNVTNPGSLRRVALYNGSTELAEVAGGATLSFTGLTLSTADGASTTLTLYASFNSSVTDNQQFSVALSGATADVSGSLFTTLGTPTTLTTADENRIEVTASTFVFTTQPSNTQVNVAMSNVVAQARDVNNNLDADFAALCEITSTGTLTGSPVTATAAAGIVTFSGLTHTVDGTGLVLTVASSAASIAGVSSNTFAITPLPILTFDFDVLAGNEVSAGSASNDSNIGSSTMTRGSGLTASGNGGRFNATGYGLTFDTNDYFEFTITPNSGYEFSVAEIAVNTQRSGTGPNTGVLRSSLDGYASDLGTTLSNTGTTTQLHTFTVNQTSNLSAVTYRIYFYGTSNSGGSFGIGDEGASGVSLAVYGSTAVNSTDCNDPLACNYNAASLGITECVYPTTTYYIDVDGDGYASGTIVACSPGVGYTTTMLPTTDCDDNDFDINPGATEIACNGTDDNCVAGIDEGSITGCMDDSPGVSNYNPAATCPGICSYGGAWTAGNLVVSRIGSGDAYPTGSVGVAMFLEQITPAGSAVSTLPMATVGTERLVISGSSTAEGFISRTESGDAIVVPGYDAAVGTTSLTSTATAAPRVANYIDLSYAPVRGFSSTSVHTNGNMRSAFKVGSDYYTAGSNLGIHYITGGTPSVISTGITNTRVINAFNGNVYFSTGSGTQGIYQVGSGYPTASTTNTLVVATGTGSSPYDFVFSADGNTLYVADDRTSAAGGVYRYEFDGSAWSQTAQFYLGSSYPAASSIAVDFYTYAQPRIYVVSRLNTSSPSVVGYFDDNAETGTVNATFNIISTSAANTLYRSIEFAPCNGITWYRDADGDGFGDASSTLVNCTQPFGYVSDATDCNDASSVSYPGAWEICNNIDDDCDVTVDESCVTPAVNDNRATAKLILNASLYPACNNTYGDLGQATPSPQALTTEPSGAGQDLWYRIVPTTGAIRVNVTTSSNDLMLELQDAAGTVLVSSENENGNGGTETLVANGLTIGENYYLAVRNFNTSASGSFTMCVQHFGVPTLSSSSTVNNLCSLLSQNWLGASSYTATFNDGTNDYSYTSASTKKQLSLFGLTYNQIYTLTFTSTFNVTDAAGNPTVITTTSNPVTFTVGYPQDLVVRNSDVCSSASRPLNSFIATSTTLCGLTGYEWEFVETDAGDALAGTPIYAMGNGSSRFIQLGASKIPGIQAGDYYRVKVRAVFAGGQSPWPSTYQLVCITGTAPEMTEENNEEVAWVNADASAVVYPNPNTGDMFNLNVNGLSDGVWNVQVLDVQGRIVHTEQVVAENGINRTVSLNSTLSNGLYTVRLMNGDAALNVRMIVE